MSSGETEDHTAMGKSSKYVRCSHDYRNLSSQYVLKVKQFHLQYAHIYASRLWTVAPHAATAARRQWGGDIAVRKLAELRPGEECVVIGTLVKKTTLRSDVLLEIGKNYHFVPQPPRDKYAHDSDCLVLEDENQRISLVGNVDVQRVVTGSVVAVRGCVDGSDGKFVVDDFTYRAVPDQIPRPASDVVDKYLVIVSGLDFGREDAANLFPLQLLADLLTGQLGDEVTQAWMTRIVRLVVAGNVASAKMHASCADKRPPPNVIAKEVMSAADDFLAQLAAGLDVDVMPGTTDPTNFMLPQQPLHRCLFPKATRYESFHCVTNPYNFSIDGLEILGTSGQPVTDVCRFGEFNDHLEALEHTLRVGHVAPTAPDSTACYPQSDEDPFVIERCPHVYFCGNATQLSTKILNGEENQTTLLVTVPSFSQTFTCAAVNLRNLDVIPIQLLQNSLPTAAKDNYCTG